MIWPENWDAVQVFQSSASQWRKIAMGGISEPERLVTLGLDYPAVESVIRFLKIADPSDTFYRLQVMEAEVLEAFAEHARHKKSQSFHL